MKKIELSMPLVESGEEEIDEKMLDKLVNNIKQFIVENMAVLKEKETGERIAKAVEMAGIFAAAFAVAEGFDIGNLPAELQGMGFEHVVLVARAALAGAATLTAETFSVVEKIKSLVSVAKAKFNAVFQEDTSDTILEPAVV